MKPQPVLATLCLVATGLAFLAVGALTADESAPQPLKATPEELRLLPGGHAWKWRFGQAKPYREITVVLVRCTRKPDGTFERDPLTATTYSGGKARAADAVLVLCAADKGDLRVCIDLSNGATRSMGTYPRVKWADFSPTGPGTGGVPPKVGADYVLLGRGKDGKPANRKGEWKAEDLDAYIGVRLQTK